MDDDNNLYHILGYYYYYFYVILIVLVAKLWKIFKESSYLNRKEEIEEITQNEQKLKKIYYEAIVPL
jgi:hypothetical protein